MITQWIILSIILIEVLFKHTNKDFQYLSQHKKKQNTYIYVEHSALQKFYADINVPLL